MGSGHRMFWIERGLGHKWLAGGVDGGNKNLKTGLRKRYDYG
jgi:hypothetical protein